MRVGLRPAWRRTLSWTCRCSFVPVPTRRAWTTSRKRRVFMWNPLFGRKAVTGKGGTGET